MKTLHHKTIRLTGLALAAFAIAAFPQSPPSNLTVPPTTIDSGTQAYQAANSIVTTAGTNDITIGDTASVLFQVTNTNNTSITLLPGFTATAGSAAATFNSIVGPLATTPTPVNGTQPVNTPQTTAFTFQNTGDSQPIAGGDITFLLLDGSGNILNQCPVEFAVSPMSFSLLDTGTHSDGACTISSNSSMSVGSQVVTVNLDVTFQVAGTYTVNTDAIDAVGLLLPWQAAGTWTVTAAAGPTFTISAPSPSSVTVAAGSSTSFVESFQAQNGFNSSVSLSYSGAPSGLTFSPSSVTVSGSSAINQTITVTAPSGTAPGNYTVTITATGGNVTQTATLQVTVTQPDFTLSTPSLVTAVQGGASTSFTQQVTALGGLTGSVTLVVGGLPTGISVSFSPSTVALSGSATVTASASASAVPNTGGNPYQIALTATYNSQGLTISHSTVVQIMVSPAPTFTLSAPSPSIAIPISVSPPTYVSFTQTATGANGFTGTPSIFPGWPGSPSLFASYTIPGSGELNSYTPGSLSVTFSSPSGNTIPGQVNVNSLNGIPGQGLYTFYFTATATSNGVTTTIPFTVTFTLGTVPPFTLTGPPVQPTLYAGGTGTLIAVTVNPVNGTTPSYVTFSLSNNGVTVQSTVTRPSGASAASSYSGTINVQAQTSAPMGYQAPTISAVGSGGGAAVQLPLLVNVQPGVTISAAPTNVMIGGSAPMMGSVKSMNGFSGTVNVAATGLPSAVSASSANVTVSSGGTQAYSLLVVAASDASQGSQFVTVGAGGATTTPPLSVTPGFSVNQISLAPYVAPTCTVSPCPGSGNFQPNPNFTLSTSLAANRSVSLNFQTCYLAPPSAQCQSMDSGGGQVTVCPTGWDPTLCTGPFSFPVTSSGTQTFLVTVPQNTTPSAANGFNWASITATYQINYTVECNGCSGGENYPGGVIPVYVMAPSTANIHITPNLGAVDMYNYNGQDAPPGDSASSPPCVLGIAGFRDCMRIALQQWQTQGVTGVTIDVPLCSSDFGAGVITGCDGTPSIDPAWAGYFATFLQDLAEFGMANLGLRPVTTDGGTAEGEFGPVVGTTTGISHQGSCGSDSWNDSYGTGSYDATKSRYLQYIPSLPFALMGTQDSSGKFSGYGTYSLNNDGYTCSLLDNPNMGPGGNTGHGPNFVGWPLIFKAFDVVFQQMSAQSIKLQALDLFSEGQISLGETVLMRMIYDPVNTTDLTTLPSGEQLSISTCPTLTSAPTGGTDVLGWLRCLAIRWGLDPGGITMSSNERTAYNDSLQHPDLGVSTPATMADPGIGNCATTMYFGSLPNGYTQSGTLLPWPPSNLLSTTYHSGTPFLRAPTGPLYGAPGQQEWGVCCPNHYGDDSRADDVSMLVNAMLGNAFGDAGDSVVGDSYTVPNGGPTMVGRNTTSGLYCMVAPGDLNGAPSIAGALATLGGPVYAPPRVFDWHSYPQLLDLTTTATEPQWVALTAREAQTSFDAFQDVINKYYAAAPNLSPGEPPPPTLPCPPAPQSCTSILQISETHSPDVAGSAVNCQGYPAADTWLSFLGLRQSTAAAAGVIVRPFAVFSPCLDLAFYPAAVITNGYDLTQP